jgi:putative Ca2+/H+ antiporter (TMEM165/GDT1 family)
VDLRLFATIFGTIFMAELGDKTQLATLLYASDTEVSRWTVFAASAAALVLTSAIGVAAGSVVSQWISPRVLSRVAGLGFIAIGIWTLVRPAD